MHYVIKDGLWFRKSCSGYFDKALAIDPNDQYALGDKGDALNGLGKYKEAITYFDKALTINPSDKNALILKQIVQAKH